MSIEPALAEPTRYISVDRHFADELVLVAKFQGAILKKGHANEIVAQAHGFRTHAAMHADGLMTRDRYSHDRFDFDVDSARKRAGELESPVAEDFGPVAQSLRALHEEARKPFNALAARLARNVCLNAEWSRQFDGFAGRTLLSPEDFAECVGVAMRDDFEDGLWPSRGARPDNRSARAM